MPTMSVRITSKKMPHTSEFFAVVKAVERFYYAQLFSTDSAYDHRSEPWTSWVDQGFSAAIRVPPPGTEPMDRLHMSVRSDGKLTELTASSESSERLDRLTRLLAAVDAYRTAGEGPGGSTYTEIQKQLLDPVAEALRLNAVPSTNAKAIMAVLEKGIDALCYRDIIAIELAAVAEAS
jgi:hypothetical protein